MKDGSNKLAEARGAADKSIISLPHFDKLPGDTPSFRQEDAARLSALANAIRHEVFRCRFRDRPCGLVLLFEGQL